MLDFNNNAQQFHDTVARYYDASSLSMRDALWHVFQDTPSLGEKYFHSDKHHPSCVGHKSMALMLLALISDALEQVGVRAKSSWPDRLPNHWTFQI